MKKRLSIVLCIAMILCMIPATSSYAVKKVKAKSVSVAPKSMTLAVGDVAQLTATKKPAKSTDKLTWSSADKKVATVTNKGLVTGVSEGKTTITVKTKSKKTAKCTVVVKKYVTEDDIRKSLEEELKKTFATKDDLQTLLSQNTYTKDEIDNMISEATSNKGDSNWEDGTEVKCMNFEKLPKPVVITKTLRDTKYVISVTINDISCKKYRNAEFEIDDNGTARFYPYKYEYYVSYNVVGLDEYNKAAREAPGEVDCVLLDFGLINEGIISSFNLDNSKTSLTEVRYSCSDCDEFFIQEIGTQF